MDELADCLLAHPDAVTHVYLARNQLTDETGQAGSVPGRQLHHRIAEPV